MEVDDLIKALILLIPAGAFVRIVFCFLKMIGNEEDAPMYRKRMINAGIFLAIVVSIWQIKDIVFYYFG